MSMLERFLRKALAKLDSLGMCEGSSHKRQFDELPLDFIAL